VRGHSLSRGRSRCCSKVGPGRRSHVRKSLQRESECAEDGRPQPVQPVQRLPVDPAIAALPPITSSEPVVRVRRFSDRDVQVHDFTPRVP
jgi:hypothetical protein